MREGCWISVGSCPGSSFFLLDLIADLSLSLSRRAVELVLPTKSTVKIPHIKEVVQTLQNSPTAAFLRDLSFHERVMLTSLIKCVKREGVEEVKLSGYVLSISESRAFC